MINIRNDSVYHERRYYMVENLKPELYDFIQLLVSKKLFEFFKFKYDEIESILIHKNIKIIHTQESIAPDLVNIEYIIGISNAKYNILNDIYCSECPPVYILDTRTIYHIGKKDINTMVQNGINNILPNMVHGIFTEHTHDI